MGGRLGAWVAAALAALNITVNSITAPLTDLSEFLSDPLGATYTYTEQGLDSYYSNQVIQISDNVVTIDGMPYYDVWLSHDAAEKFRVNAFDFKSAYSLTSNSNATFASGAGILYGLPIYDLGGGTYRYRSQEFNIPGIGTYQIGDMTLDVFLQSSQDSKWSAKTIYPDGTFTQWSSNGIDKYPFTFSYRSANTQSFQPFVNGARKSSIIIPGTPFTSLPFDFDYVSGVIPADQTLGPDDGLLIHVPAEDGQGNDTPIVQWVQDHPDTVGTDWHIDAPNADIDLDSLLDTVIIPLIPILKAEFAEQPIITPTPVDPTTIAGTSWITLDNRLSTIIQALNPLPYIQTGVTNLSTQLGNLINNIQSGFGDTISAMTSLGDAILQDIELGPIRVFDKALDLLKSLFASILALVKNAIGIWHYVVDWLVAIAAPFTFFMGCYSAMGNVFMLPIYAVVAGTIVIAVYRRFGR